MSESLPPQEDPHAARSREELLGYIRDLERQALHDSLTGLPNRALFEDRLEQTIAGSARRGHQFAVLLCDLDRLKPVNDRYGHEAGDAMLREVADRFRATLRASDSVARLGGDEFAVILADTDRERAELAVRRLAAAFEPPLRFGRFRIPIGLSIGSAVYPVDAEDAVQLLRAADASMYAVKARRKLFSLGRARQMLSSTLLFRGHQHDEGTDDRS